MGCRAVLYRGGMSDPDPGRGTGPGSGRPGPPASTLLARVAETVEQVAAVPARTDKVARLGGLLGELVAAEVEPVIGMLTAAPRQGRTGVGWRTLADLHVAPAAVASLTVAEVDDTIEALTRCVGPQSGAQRAELLRSLWARATEAEQRLLAAVLLGEVRMGALAALVTDAVAAASGRPVGQVRRAVMLSGSLGATAALALGGGDLSTVGLTVGTPVLPMLAAPAAGVAEALTVTGPASVETKLDGARIQVHRLGGPGAPVRVYSRSLADISERVPEIVSVTAEFPGGAMILDGETLALHEDGSPRPFQETMSSFGASSPRAQALRPWYFDVLHADGRDLLDEPLRERRRVLRELVGEFAVPALETADPIAAEEFSRRALAAGHEGVVVKSLEARYAAGRRGKHWLKVKPVLTYDLVVLAAEWGSGRRTGWLSNLHLGARDPAVPIGAPGAFVMVGKTFKGLTDELLRWQTARFAELETRRSAATVFLRPELVVEIAVDGVQRSSRYPGGVALRFARVKRYRDDKLPQDADSIDALRQLLA